MKNFFVYSLLFISILLLSYAIYNRFFKEKTYDPLEGVELTTVSISKRNINLGEVGKREDAVGEFIVKNTGSNDLVITNVEVSCTCSAAVLLDNKIAPNDSVFIKVRYAKKLPSYFYSDVLVHGNFPGSPQILSFEGIYNGNDIEIPN
ncbi:MAG TPA: hypothetical protein DEQ87_11260 [Algoriphagus sp.]|jgi:hypothetical protein|uniref:DUF1573 domain-containing protein n=1 Tax=unclassified Algoriphagus TaxID=2641541 RepID=UPI000C56B968|nr:MULTISPECIES: DUF1573 domain-containing protein [unclassified Algoriphagus]MAL13231.1 hypothetical protein [Algoriphagus sp.]HAD52235.1 hypothetical protein [Algoriphagus sp.]HAH35223.1 hypothetical protein [Algoriphagus sp.]HAS57863.1 hypothetical protein [Algoriphagus sp.]HAZ24455.1 hypothetical protein [Algoriphagus sp.]|tara:strand:- start:673 stop:1116 length:444 start_codon:yes stop_codon:yes gene_type:complete